jgi:hypothetical protein
VEDGVVAAALELIAIDETRSQLEAGASAWPWSAGEIGYARSKSDPERRLGARHAAASVLLLRSAR